MRNVEQNFLDSLGMMPTIPNQRLSDVVLSYRIAAKSSRVMFALSIPEYIEAWLQAPDAEDFQLVFSPEAEEAFRIDLYRAEKLQRSVYSSCRVMGSNQVRYTWKTTSPGGIPETLVDMQLRDSSEGCILGLKHSGFKSSGESAWYFKMWYQSLERLSRLMARN